MKVSQLVSLVCSVTVASTLAGCSSNVGKTPQTAETVKAHGLYWKANPKDSVAKNAFSLAGIDVSFSEQEIKPGGDADDFLSKLLISGSMGYVTGGLSGLSIMSLSSLYSDSDAEYMQLSQYVVFVPNPTNLPYDNEKLVRDGAKYIYSYTKDDQIAHGYNPEKQQNALNTCKMDMAIMNKWNTCGFDSKPEADVTGNSVMYRFQVIRPATGKELPLLNLPTDNYSVIRYTFIPSKGIISSANFNGLIVRADNPEFTAPPGLAASIKGKDYYLFKGDYGQKGFPEKVLKNPSK